MDQTNQEIVDALVVGGVLNKVDLRGYAPDRNANEPVIAYFVVTNLPTHVCDWRFYARRPDGLADVVCLAEGHDVNTRFRVAPMIVSNDLLPKYEGQFDLPQRTRFDR